VSGNGIYRADGWQIVTDDLGYDSIHETNENGGPGDLVCDVFGDSKRSDLIAAAPDLYAALSDLIPHVWVAEGDDALAAKLESARDALLKATGKSTTNTQEQK
jgi:hypothetical protein